MDLRRNAILTGVSLILMAVFAGFSFGYAYPEFYNLNELNLIKENIVSNYGLFKNMLIGILLILILDLIVSISLYQFFRVENQKIAFASAVIRVIYTFIFLFASFYLLKNLSNADLTNQEMKQNFGSFQFIWNCGLISFGFHIILIGWLMKLHQKIPKYLWLLTLLAGFCYVFLHLLKIYSVNPEMISQLEMILALPMALGEVGLAVWLLIKGGK